MAHEFDAEFLIWYAAFPRHTGKLAAEKSYLRARKMATAEELIDGIEAYKRAKHPDADVCHPATFLNQGRWMDEAPPAPLEFRCPHTPTCAGRHACHIKQVLGR